VIVEQNVTDEEAAAHHIVDMVSHGELRVKRHATFPYSVVWKHSGASAGRRLTDAV